MGDVGVWWVRRQAWFGQVLHFVACTVLFVVAWAWAALDLNWTLLPKLIKRVDELSCKDGHLTMGLKQVTMALPSPYFRLALILTLRSSG